MVAVSLGLLSLLSIIGGAQSVDTLDGLHEYLQGLIQFLSNND